MSVDIFLPIQKEIFVCDGGAIGFEGFSGHNLLRVLVGVTLKWKVVNCSCQLPSTQSLNMTMKLAES